MIKILGGIFVGVFLGVLTVKLLNKAKGELKEAKPPRFLQKAGNALREGMKAAKNAFMDGYATENK